MASSDTVILTRSDIFDLYKTDLEIRKAYGIGILPPIIAKHFEKYAILGPEAVNPEKVKEDFEEFQRAREEILSSYPKEPISIEA